MKAEGADIVVAIAHSGISTVARYGMDDKDRTGKSGAGLSEE